MASKRAKKQQKWIVLVLVLLVLGFFLFFGKSSPLHGKLGDPSEFLDRIEDILGFDKKKPLITTNLADARVSVHYINVGQGDAVLIRTPEGDILIDGGETDKGKQLVEYLDGVGVTRFSLVVATHPHSDHIGGLPPVLRKFPTDQLILPELPTEIIPTSRSFTNLLDVMEEKNIMLVSPEVGSRYTFGPDITFTVVGFMEDSPDLNNISLVTRLDVGEVSYLFTGDLEILGEEDLLKRGGKLRADVLNLGIMGLAHLLARLF